MLDDDAGFLGWCGYINNLHDEGGLDGIIANLYIHYTTGLELSLANQWTVFHHMVQAIWRDTDAGQTRKEMFW